MVEIGYSGTISSVSGQQGEAARVVNWVNDSWLDIQKMRADWRFMLKPMSAAIVSGLSTFQLPTNNLSIKDGTLVLVSASGEKIYPEAVTPEELRRIERVQGSRQGRPEYYSIDESSVLKVFPAAQENYDIEADCYQRPSKMTLNEDEPTLPERFHLGILWHALMSAGGYEEAPNSWQRGSAKWYEYLSDINKSELPKIKHPRPIA